MGITFGDHLIDSGHHDITPEQEREIEAREECAKRGLDPDDDAADGVLVWMVVDQEMREHRNPSPQKCHACNGTGLVEGTTVGCAVCEGKTTLGAVSQTHRSEREIEHCADCGQELPILYPCHEQGCAIKCRF